MSGMRDVLRKRLDWLNPDARERAIDDVLVALRTPTPFMVEEGAFHVRENVEPLKALKEPAQRIAELVFSAMALRASEGG